MTDLSPIESFMLIFTCERDMLCEAGAGVCSGAYPRVSPRKNNEKTSPTNQKLMELGVNIVLW